MGLFDIFRSSESIFKGHADRVANKRSNNQDRWASLVWLAKQESAEAAAALFKRFDFRADPSITDQEEKDLALQGILAAGDAALKPAVDALKNSEHIAWPVKAIQQLADETTLVGSLLEILEGMDTEYERDPQRKIDIIAVLETVQDDRVCESLERFLLDASENVRFHAAASIFAQENPISAKETLEQSFLKEESARLRSAMAKNFAATTWTFDESDELSAAMPQGFALTEGKVVSKG